MVPWRLFRHPWWSSSRVLGVAACIVGFGLMAWPDRYTNPSFRVLFAYLTPRQAGLIWAAIGVLSIVAVGRWSIVLLGTALLGWGLGLGAAALGDGSGSPLGWVWFVGFGLAVLRTLAVSGPARMRS